MAKPYPYFVSLTEAINLCQKTQIELDSETIQISQSINRIISKDIHSKVNDPSFDNSAMDGFAVIYSDTLNPPKQLSIIGKTRIVYF
jgi:molybdopterin molybdotransferase